MKHLIALAVALAVITTAAEGQTFTSRPAWESAVGSQFVLETFNSVPTGQLPIGVSNVGSVQAEVGSAAMAFVWTPGTVDGTRDLLTGVSQNAGHFFKIIFPHPVYGFGADFISAVSTGLLTVTYGSTTLQFDSALTAPGNGFLGIVSANPFTEIEFRSESTTPEGFELDNLAYTSRTFSAVPEPGSIALLAGGGIPLLGLLRRRLRT